MLLSEQEKLLEKLEALRQADHLQQHNHQHASLEFAPKKVLEIDHTNGSVNSSGDGSGWTEVSVTPQVMEMKQASEAGLRDNCRLLLRNLDTGALMCQTRVRCSQGYHDIHTCACRAPPHVSRRSSWSFAESHRRRQRAHPHTRIRHWNSGERHQHHHFNPSLVMQRLNP